MISPDQQAACVNYALEVLLGPTDASATGGVIHYGCARHEWPDEPAIIFVPSPFFREYGRATSIPQPPLEDIDGIPLLFGEPHVDKQGRRFIVHADIIASTYFLTTRYEEIVQPDVRDSWGRFPGKHSLPFRAGFLDRPVVDEYAELLRTWLREVGCDLGGPSRQFKVVLTHDIDHPRKYDRFSQPLRQVVKAVLRREPWTTVSDSLLAPLGWRQDPFDCCEEMIRLAKGLQQRLPGTEVESFFFFMADGTLYSVSQKHVQDAIRCVRNTGFTVGLHASDAAGRNSSLLRQEKKRLEAVAGCEICHNRYHFLSWLDIQDGHVLAQNGLTWDSSLGYADMAGFRLGVCHPIPLFDPVSLVRMDVEEHPLMIMDVTLTHPNYMNLSYPEARDVCRRIIRRVYEHKGELVVLWHNNNIIGPGANRYLPDLYRNVLSDIQAVASADHTIC